MSAALLAKLASSGRSLVPEGTVHLDPGIAWSGLMCDELLLSESDAMCLASVPDAAGFMGGYLVLLFGHGSSWRFPERFFRWRIPWMFRCALPPMNPRPH